MIIKLKNYSRRYRNPAVKARLKWNPEFLSTIINRYSMYGKFTATDIARLFDTYPPNSIKLKLKRMYTHAWFHRELKPIDVDYGRRNVYVYSFSPSAIHYFSMYGGFDTMGPLVEVKSKRSVEEN